jgi:hypothetical protein
MPRGIYPRKNHEQKPKEIPKVKITATIEVPLEEFLGFQNPGLFHGWKIKEVEVPGFPAVVVGE